MNRFFTFISIQFSRNFITTSTFIKKKQTDVTEKTEMTAQEFKICEVCFENEKKLKYITALYRFNLVVSSCWVKKIVTLRLLHFIEAKKIIFWPQTVFVLLIHLISQFEIHFIISDKYLANHP